MSSGSVSVVLGIFALTYLAIAIGRVPGLKLDRTGIALLGAIAIMVFSGLPTDTIIGYIHWPTILLLFGFFVMSAQLRLSGFFDMVADGIARGHAPPARFLLQLMLVTAALSAFLNHDIVCFVFTPVVAVTLVRRRINPTPFLVALAVASNIGGAATLVGNPQDMMIGQIAGLGFGQYLLWCLPPVLFALGSSYAIIWALSRRHLEFADGEPGASIHRHRFNRPHTIKGLTLLLLVVALLFTSLPKELIALTAAGVHLASPKFRSRDMLGLVDWPILILFAGLFVVTGAFDATGAGERAVEWCAQNGLHLQSLPVLAIATAVISNLINNAAAVMLLAKLTNVTDPQVAFVLALANSFGGSLIITGSVSNIIVLQQAHEMGITISFRDFARLGVPVTLVALGGFLLWLMV